MRIAVFESSGPRCSVALADDTGPLIDWSGEFGHAIAGPMLEGLRGLLMAMEWGLVDLDALGAGIGPGSFTGIKIATTLAKTLAHANEKLCVGVSNLEALANDVRTSSRIAALLPSKKEWVYLQLFDNRVPVSEPETMAVADVPERLTSWTQETILVASSVEIDGLPENAAMVFSNPPSAGSVARVAIRKALAGGLVHPVELLPLYVAPPSVTMPKKPFK